MKYHYPVRRLTQLVLCAGLLCMFIFSCKKETTVYVPVPQPTPEVSRDVFTDGSTSMLSEYEQKNRKSFQAGMMHSTLKGIGPMDVFKGIFGVYSAIHKYEQEKQFAQDVTQMKNDLESISNQLSELSQQMNQLKTEGAIIAAAIIDDITSTMTAADFSNISTYYDTVDDHGLRYYSRIQYYCQHNYFGYDTAYMKTLDADAQARAQDVTSGQGNQVLGNAITNLSYYILPNPSLQPNYLRMFATQIVGVVEQQNRYVTQQEAMNLYLILENYFLQIINYQMQAITVIVNGYNTIDTLQAKHTWDSYMSLILKETNTFLSAVDYLAVSLYDYRNPAQFENDLKYYSYGIAPENTMNTVLSRSQFIACLLYDLGGIAYPVINGSVVVPNFYNETPGSGTAGKLEITAGGQPLGARCDTLISSPLPYIYWLSSSQFTPSNQWMVVNYGRFGGTQDSLPCSPQAITLSGANWGNSKPIQGSVTPRWYNPRNPGMTSSTKNDSCFIQFAYFAAGWKWGYFTQPRIPSHARQQLYWNVVPTVTSDICVFDNPVPWSAQWHSVEQIMKNYWIPAMNYPSGTLFCAQMSGTLQSYSSGEVWTVDMDGAAVSAVSFPSNLSVNCYVSYDYQVNCPVLSSGTLRIGTSLNLYSPCSPIGGPQCYNSNGNIFNSPATSASGINFAAGLQPGSALNLNYECYLLSKDQKENSSYNVYINIIGQWGAGGFYPQN